MINLYSFLGKDTYLCIFFVESGNHWTLDACSKKSTSPAGFIASHETGFWTPEDIGNRWKYDASDNKENFDPSISVTCKP